MAKIALRIWCVSDDKLNRIMSISQILFGLFVVPTLV